MRIDKNKGVTVSIRDNSGKYIGGKEDSFTSWKQIISIVRTTLKQKGMHGTFKVSAYQKPPVWPETWDTILNPEYTFFKSKTIRIY